MTEAEIHKRLVEYIGLQYPGVLFHSDTGSGMRLTIGQAKAQRHLQGGRRAWPDILIAEARGSYHGLFLELKRDGVKIFTRSGVPVSNPHIREQLEVLAELTSRGYVAQFAVGFDQAVKIIDWYLKGPTHDQ